MPWPEKSRPLAIERLEELDRLEKKARPGPWELVKQPDTRERAVSRVIAGFFAWNAPTPDAQLDRADVERAAVATHRSQAVARPARHSPRGQADSCARRVGASDPQVERGQRPLIYADGRVSLMNPA